MNIKKGLYYAETHEWVQFTGKGTALVGISDHAQSELGDIAFVNLCEEGDMLTAGEVMGDIESIKAVSDIYAPVSGKVIAVNGDAADEPESINAAPYDAWLLEIECDEGTDGLMDDKAYEAFLG